MAQSELLRYCIYGLCLGLLFVAHGYRRRAPKSQLLLQRFLEKVQKREGFALEEEPVAAHRPFDPPKRGSLKMGLTRIEQDQWLLIDRNLKETLEDREAALEEWPGRLILCNEVAGEAIRELYDLMGRFLCQRYPEHYEMGKSAILNKVLGQKLPFPAATSGLSSKGLLELMAKNYEEDVLLLEYCPEAGEYRLRAGNFLYAAGFDPRILLNYSLSKIHGPVPHYHEDLQTPMNRFFERIETGQYVQRLNWSLQQGPARAIPDHELGNSIGRKKNNDPEKGEKVEINVEKMNVRVERQTLSRLPRTRYLVFTIRTYLYPVPEIKREGLGPSLAQSIENLDFYMAQYKGRDYWGDAVVDYLRA